MTEHYSAIVKQKDGWWIGWLEKVLGVSCQETSQEGLHKSLSLTLRRHNALDDDLE